MLILRLLNQQQLARNYDVVGRWILSTKCYLAAYRNKSISNVAEHYPSP
jgi:hypothetical protein